MTVIKVNFDVKKFNELWECLDAEDKSELLLDRCNFNPKQVYSILIINDRSIYESSIKQAVEFMGFNDNRAFERYRAKQIQRIINILNSPKYNYFYSSYYHPKK
jgi:hypothetical protein